MSAPAVKVGAMTATERAAHVRGWFKRWRREFRAFELPRLAPVQLGTLAESIGWRVTAAHGAQFQASDALRSYVRASGDERLQALVDNYLHASVEVESSERVIQAVERAELDYLRGVVWPDGRDQRQVLPRECDRLHEWFRE